MLAAERYLTSIRERELYIEKLLELYIANVLFYYDENEVPPVGLYRSPNESWIVSDEEQLIKTRVIDDRGSFIEKAQANLRQNQGSVFSFSSYNEKLTCLIHKKDFDCWLQALDYKTFEKNVKSLGSSLEALELGDDMIRTERLGEVLFPKDVINKINQLRLKHVFFVPESEYWSLPLQWLWSKTGSKASLVAAPTVQSLSLDYQPVQPNRVKYDYVGVGDPDYSAKDIMPTTNVASIPGVAFRSASYAADLTQLNQLPYTNEEIRESSANFEGEKLLLLKSRASEKTLDQYDWGSSKFIHFAPCACFGRNEGYRRASHCIISRRSKFWQRWSSHCIRNRSPEFYRQLRPSKWMQNSLRFWFSSGSRPERLVTCLSWRWRKACNGYSVANSR